MDDARVKSLMEKLRTWSDVRRHGAIPGGDLMAAAADEIERLQHVVTHDLAIVIERLSRENRRLRNALQEISSMTMDEPMRGVARGALQDEATR